MPTYTYKCPDGHVTELVLPLADDKPETVRCKEDVPREAARMTVYLDVDGEQPKIIGHKCGRDAARVFHAPIAVHWSGAGGSYHEDVYRNEGGRYGWKRRANPADSLPVEVS